MWKKKNRFVDVLILLIFTGRNIDSWIGVSDIATEGDYIAEGYDTTSTYFKWYSPFSVYVAPCESVLNLWPL